MARSVIPTGRQRNSFKKDFVFYSGGGLGGGGSAIAMPSQRQTFWIDHNPFATAIRQLIVQNVSFEVYSAVVSGIPVALSEVPMWLHIDQSNDCPPEIIQSAAEIAATRTLYYDPSINFPGTGIREVAPYTVTTQFLTNPADFNYQNDQGRYVYNAYAGGGFGMAKTGAGAYDAILQSFVPTSPFLTGVWLKNIFRIGSTSDHTLYSDMNLNLYDSNGLFVAQIGKLSKRWPLAYLNTPPVTGVGWNSAGFTTADDGLQYWTTINEIHFIPNQPIAVTPGQTYYLGVRPDTYGATANYGVGANNNGAGGSYNGDGQYYLFGQAYTGVLSGSNMTSLSAIGTKLSICFVTQRNVGRTAYTFSWNVSPSYGYPTALDQFKFIKEDFDQRI